MTGRELGPYLILGLIGSGSKAEVYLGEHRHLKKRAALKVLPSALASSQEAVVSLTKEAVQLAKVDHPNVVRVLDFAIESGTPYLAMEYVEGQTLAQRLRAEGKLPAAQLQSLTRDILAGLQAIHAAGMVHGDIKPSNILIDQDGKAKLTDFGIAREKPDAAEPRTTLYTGTAEYAAPEMALGRPSDVSTDLYALGATLYRTVTGTLPFTGKTTKEKLQKQLYEPVAPPRTFAPDLPPPTETLILRLMSKDREGRPSSAEEATRLLSLVSLGESRKKRGHTVRALRKRSKAPSVVSLLLLVGLLIGLIALILIVLEERKALEDPTAGPVPDLPLGPEPKGPSIPKKDPSAPPQAERRSHASVLLLKGGTYVTGVVKAHPEVYEVIEGSNRQVIDKSDVERWYRYSSEMASGADQDFDEAKTLLERAHRMSAAGTRDALLSEAKFLAERARGRFTLTRKHFTGSHDAWLDDRLRRTGELLRLIRDLPLAKNAKSPEKKPQAAQPAAPQSKPSSPQPAPVVKTTRALESLLHTRLLDPEERGNSIRRRALRDELLAGSGQWKVGVLRDALLVYLSRTEEDWGIRRDYLTLKSSSIEYPRIPGRVRSGSSSIIQFELRQGGTVRINAAGNTVYFTPPGGSSQRAEHFELEKGIPTPEYAELEAYFGDIFGKNPEGLNQEDHARGLLRLSASLRKLAAEEEKTEGRALRLFLAAHASELFSLDGVNPDPKVVKACKDAGLTSLVASRVWVTPEAASILLQNKDIMGSDLNQLEDLAKDSSKAILVSRFIEAHRVLGNLPGADYADFQAGWALFDQALKRARPARLREYLQGVIAHLKTLAPCKTCRGVHHRARQCQGCKGKGRTNYRCSKCGGHGYVQVLSTKGLQRQTCRTCRGAGWFKNVSCKRCSGAGALSCRDCKAPRGAATSTEIGTHSPCSMCGGDGTLFRYALERCPDCLGLGWAFAPGGDSRKAYSRAIRTGDMAQIALVQAPSSGPDRVYRLFNGKDFSNITIPDPSMESAWRISDGVLSCNHADLTKNATLNFEGMRIPQSGILKLAFTGAAAVLSKGAGLGIEFVSADGQARWVCQIVFPRGTFGVYEYTTTRRAWTPLGSRLESAYSLDEQDNGSEIELGLEGRSLIVTIPGKAPITYTLSRALTGGRIGLQWRGGTVQLSRVTLAAEE